MTALSDYIPYVLVGVVVISVSVSVIYIGMSAGNSDTRNELQKQISILTATNVITTFFMGWLMYYYLLSNTQAIIPFTVFMLTFNLFLSIMSVSISLLQQLHV